MVRAVGKGRCPLWRPHVAKVRQTGMILAMQLGASTPLPLAGAPRAHRLCPRPVAPGAVAATRMSSISCPLCDHPGRDPAHGRGSHRGHRARHRAIEPCASKTCGCHAYSCRPGFAKGLVSASRARGSISGACCASGRVPISWSSTAKAVSGRPSSRLDGVGLDAVPAWRGRGRAATGKRAMSRAMSGLLTRCT